MAEATDNSRDIEKLYEYGERLNEAKDKSQIMENHITTLLKSVERVVENFKSDQISEPSNFKYWIALEKQLTSTMLHLLSLAARSNHQAIRDFLVKKASFLEVWIKDLCSSLGDTRKSLDEGRHVMCMDQKRDVLFRTIQSLVELPEEWKLDLLKNLAECSSYAKPQDSRQLLPSVVQHLKGTRYGNGLSLLK